MNTTQVTVEAARLAVLAKSKQEQDEYDRGMADIAASERRSPLADFTNDIGKVTDKADAALAKLDELSTLIRISDSGMISIDAKTANYLWGVK